MKQKRLLLAVLAMAMMVPVWAQQRIDPDHAQYNIIGTMSFQDGKRYLKDAHGKNIQFEYVSSRQARPTQAADLVVRFDSVETIPSGLMRGRNGQMRKLDFWRYDEEVGEWIYDSEVRQGENELESTMKTNIMLVIDNSKSLKDDFKKVQDAAIEFVGQLYRESQGRDIFRVGIIGFSTVQFTKTRAITPLDASNYRDIISFIRNLEMQNGTALYYSLETALNMLEKDASIIGSDTYKESRIYAFTDGLDQASVDDSRNLSTPTKYFDHIKPLMKNKRILGMPKKRVHSTIVTVRGDDMTDGQEQLFDRRAQEICDDVRKLDDMSKLVTEFKKLAEDLVNSNLILYCYIPVGASGRVGWTFAEEKVRKPSKFWMGVGLEGGMVVKRNYETPGGGKNTIPFFSANADFAFPLSSWFSIGASAGFSLTSQMDPGMKIGPLFKFSFRNNSAFLLGIGGLGWWGDFDDEYAFSPYFSIGWKFKSRWYLTADVSGLSFGIGIGYSIFGGR